MAELVKTDDEAPLAAMMIVVGAAQNRSENERYKIQEVARHVLWTFGDLSNGYRPGSFTETLIETICRADPSNVYKLSQSYPIHTGFVIIAQSHNFGMRFLQSIANYDGETV